MAFSLHRFEEFGHLTPSETEAVMALGGPPKNYGRMATIRREGAPANEFYMLLTGWAMSYVTLPDGGRQIMKIHLPGDALGTPSMSVEAAAETLMTITPATISPVSYQRFGTLFTDHPRVAAFFLLSCQRERVALMDWLSSVGRTSAESRLAALLIDLIARLQPLGLVRDQSFDLSLTQELIGDAIGLTAVHVNRMFRALEDQELIERDHHVLTVRDMSGLKRLAALPPRKLRSNLGWLPASR